MIDTPVGLTLLQGKTESWKVPLGFFPRDRLTDTRGARDGATGFLTLGWAKKENPAAGFFFGIIISSIKNTVEDCDLAVITAEDYYEQRVLCTLHALRISG